MIQTLVEGATTRPGSSRNPLSRWLHACLRELEQTGIPRLHEAPGAERSYQRLLPTAVGCEAWLICWPSGSVAPLHDHGSARGVAQVVRGQLSEWRSAERSAHGMTRTWHPGRAIELPHGVCHEVRNVEPEIAYSVHVYGPRLDHMTFFDRSTGELRPIGREEARRW